MNVIRSIRGVNIGFVIGIVVFIFIGYLIFIAKINFFSNTINSVIVIEPATKTAKPFVCPFRGDKWIVVTSIFYPTPAIHKFLNLTTPWYLIVIGDRKTPNDWLTRLYANHSRVLFLPIDQQASLGYAILKYLPEGSYARKNIGYLIAIACGARYIFESDDDNLIESEDIRILPVNAQVQDIPWVSFHRQRSPFVNIYGSFGHPEIWPRGFPIDELRNVTEDGWHSVRRNTQLITHAYIQQFLADLDPDVDALYRLTHPLSIGRIRFDRYQYPIAIEPYTFSPYNTQNTITHYQAFWGLYLPVTTTFRVCDIWRGFWVQRLLWDIGGQLVFGTATVQQVRNAHSYIKDMDEEHQLYHQSGSFVRFLASWSSLLPSLAQRIGLLARDMARSRFWKNQEVDILDAWLDDLHSIGYDFPAIDTSSSNLILKRKKVALCVTGSLHDIGDVWKSKQRDIYNHFNRDIDIFLFLSSSKKNTSSYVPDIGQIKPDSYMNSLVVVLYEDRPLTYEVLSNCSGRMQLSDQTNFGSNNYWQQLWAMDQCYNLIEKYETDYDYRFEILAHVSTDSMVSQSFTVETVDTLKMTTSIILSSIDNDLNITRRFAIGPSKLMNNYMTRWQQVHHCLLK